MIRRSLLACFLAAQAWAGPSRAVGQDVPAASRDREYFEEVRAKADGGDTRAMGTVAYCFETGRGVRQDYAESVRWYRKAVEVGNTRAAAGLGLLLENGLGCETNLVEALRLYRLSAERRSQTGMLALGRFSEEGILMPVDREEAVRWYRQVLDLFGVNERGAADEAAARLVRLGAFALPFDPETASGNDLADYIAGETNSVAQMTGTRHLRRVLMGRSLTYTNLVVTYVHRLPDGGLDVTLEPPKKGRKLQRWGYANLPSTQNSCSEIRVKVAPEHARVARCLDRGDILASFSGEVCDADPWYWGFVLKGTSFVPADPSVTRGAPELDTANITGDELLDYLRKHRRLPIRKWQFADLQRRLAGRRLTFHGLRLSGGCSGENRHLKKRTEFWMLSSPVWEPVGEGDETGRPTFALRFASEASERFARLVYRVDPFAKLESVTGTFRRNVDPGDGFCFQLDDVEARPQGLPTGLENLGDGPIDGPALMARLGPKCTPMAVMAARHALAEREIVFHEVAVVTTRWSVTNESIRVSCQLPCETGEKSPPRRRPSRDMPRLELEIPADQAARFRRVPIQGDLLTNVRGRLRGIPEGPRNIYARDHFFHEITLHDVSCTPALRTDVVDLEGATDLSGAELVRKFALCWHDTRPEQIARVLRGRIGSTVVFPAAQVSFVSNREDGSVEITVQLQDPVLGPAGAIRLVYSEENARKGVPGLKRDATLKNIRGTVDIDRTERPRWDDTPAGICLLNPTFEVEVQEGRD